MDGMYNSLGFILNYVPNSLADDKFQWKAVFTSDVRDTNCRVSSQIDNQFRMSNNLMMKVNKIVSFDFIFRYDLTNHFRYDCQ